MRSLSTWTVACRTRWRTAAHPRRVVSMLVARSRASTVIGTMTPLVYACRELMKQTVVVTHGGYSW